MQPASSLPLVLAGPILRRFTASRLTFWLASTSRLNCQLSLHWQSTSNHQASSQEFSSETLKSATTELQLAEHLFLQLIDLPVDAPLPERQRIYYDLKLNPAHSDRWQHCKEWAPNLCYPGHDLPFFQLEPKVKHLLHGSCRKGHYDTPDGLVRADNHLASCQTDDWPSFFMMSGDQIYADDVSMPVLYAIHQLCERLGFAKENLPHADISSTDELHKTNPYYGRREQLLPDTKAGNLVIKQVFTGAKKPIFTSDTAQNHLISFAELCCMYLLMWSEEGWNCIESDIPEAVLAQLDDKKQQKAKEHRPIVQRFRSGLSQVQRVMAHLPVAMIFDDHDVTDDWNLTREWEKIAYGQPFSRRIIGNALLSYTLFQGWGNDPRRHAELIPPCREALKHLGKSEHDGAILTLFQFQHWNYEWPTSPSLIVLDTRTQRWRSEVADDKPSGLMDWKCITDLQQQLLGKEAVLLVSPAPVFGVKLIETIQHIFTFFGKPLLVDAESWMAHSGSAYALMNLFRHPLTPKNFVILSGDVHYNFVYQVKLRSQANSPTIWQLTSCGINNEFPDRLLSILDVCNRWLYAPWSPLNWFTKRRQMKVLHHKPKGAASGRRLLNCAGVGLVKLSEEGLPIEVKQLAADGREFEFDLENSGLEHNSDISL